MGPRPVSRLQPNWRRRGSAPRWVGRRRLPPRRAARCAAAPRPRIRAPPSASPTILTALSSLAGTSELRAGPADDDGSTAFVAGVADAAIGSATDLSAARHGRSREVRVPFEKARPHARRATERPLMVAAAAAIAATPHPLRARVTHDTSTPIFRIGAGANVATMPLPCADPALHALPPSLSLALRAPTGEDVGPPTVSARRPTLLGAPPLPSAPPKTWRSPVAAVCARFAAREKNPVPHACQ